MTNMCPCSCVSASISPPSFFGLGWLWIACACACACASACACDSSRTCDLGAGDVFLTSKKRAAFTTITKFIDHYTTHPVSQTLGLYLTTTYRADQPHKLVTDPGHSHSHSHSHKRGLSKETLVRHHPAFVMVLRVYVM